MKLAHFPAVEDLASFDDDAQPSVDPRQIRDLERMTTELWQDVTRFGERVEGLERRIDGIDALVERIELRFDGRRLQAGERRRWTPVIGELTKDKPDNLPN